MVSLAHELLHEVALTLTEQMGIDRHKDGLPVSQQKVGEFRGLRVLN